MTDTEVDRPVQLIVDFSSSNIRLMTDKVQFIDWMKEVVELAGMHCHGSPIIGSWPWPGSLDKDALSGVAFLEESSFTIHTYPEKQYVHLDLFSCKDFDHKAILSFIKTSFDAAHLNYLLLERGVNLSTGRISPARIIESNNMAA